MAELIPLTAQQIDGKDNSITCAPGLPGEGSSLSPDGVGARTGRRSSVLGRPPYTSGLKGATIEAVQISDHGRSQQSKMMDREQVLGNEPEVFFARHPGATIKTAKVYWPGKSAERALAPEVEIIVEITHRQFAQRAIHRLAITASRVVGLGNRAPVSAGAVDRNHMVRILLGFEIEDQGRISDGAQRSRSKDGAFKTMGSEFAQHAPRRPGGVGQVVRHIVEVALDPVRIAKSAQLAELSRREAVIPIDHLRSSLVEAKFNDSNHRGHRSRRPDDIVLISFRL